MINVFIDANIWLSLYDFSNDDLDQFRKLSDLIDTDVNILLPVQVRDEFDRNRENKIYDALKKFNNISTQIPNMCRGYPEFNELQNKIKEIKDLHKNFIAKVEKDAKDGSLYADKVINAIFAKITPLQITTDVIKQAQLRMLVGNPPGKDRKLGDAINWETLLNKAQQDEDIFFVSADKDYRSIIDDKSFNAYLLNEWSNKKKSTLFYYSSLTDFINKHVGTIELKSENEKIDAIDQLRNSRSFLKTHSVIEQLNKFSSWSNDQIIDLCIIADENNQVGAIISDTDIHTFYTTLLKGWDNNIHNEYVKWVNDMLLENNYTE
ncbi:MAG: PIN domain-containing protein [Oscillospiraceae bacterium]|nr:PIN domain-containing protein [Oscillospiraceae bacterium]